jgi:putative ABC transport system ATP-binding protein
MTSVGNEMRARGVAAHCERLTQVYRAATGETHALRGVEATFRLGTVSSVTGPSGSGKSSLLALLALREQPSAGDVWLLGRPTTRVRAATLRELRGRHVAFVAQRPTHSLFGHLTATENVRTAARARGARREDAVALLDRLGLGPRRGARPGELSGGEQQRLAVAVAVVGGPSLVVADEPTAELDDAAAELVLAELRRHAAGGGCVVLSTHDDRAASAADRVLHLRHGVLATEREGAGERTAAIDSTGRVQLPPEALPLFPGGRARLHVDEDGVRLQPVRPVEGGS